MANYEEETASTKLAAFIEKNKKFFIAAIVIIICAVIGYIIAASVMNKATAKNHLKRQWPELRYNETEYFYALDHPAIIHYAGKKPFWRINTAFEKEWWNFAKLTGYYDDIYLKSPIPKKKIYSKNKT